MAFILKNFTSIGGETKGGQAVREFSYRVPEGETMEDVAAPNYFLPVINTLMEKDVIRLLFEDDSYLTILIDKIASNHIEVVENRIVAYATEDRAGIITIASAAEAEEGVEATKAITPATLKQETDKCVKLYSANMQAVDSDILIKNGCGLYVEDKDGNVCDGLTVKDWAVCEELNVGMETLPLCLKHGHGMGKNIAVHYVDANGEVKADGVAYVSDVEEETDRAKAVEGDLDNLATNAKENLVAAVNEANAIARGRLNAIVFESDEDLEGWFAGTFTREDGLTPSDLVMGQNIYVKNLNEPDWWVSSVPVASVEDLSVLPVDKLDLSGYRTLAEQDVIDGGKADVNLQNINDAGKVALKEVCSDRDLSNISLLGEQKISSLSGGYAGIPDYQASKIVNIGNGWTATEDGYVFMRTSAGALVNQIEVTINNVTVWSSWATNEGAGDRGSAFMPVSKGDVVYASGQHLNTLFFLPLKVNSDISTRMAELDSTINNIKATGVTGGYLGQFTSNAMGYTNINRPAGQLVCDGSIINGIIVEEVQNLIYKNLIDYFKANDDSYLSFEDYQTLYGSGEDVPYFAFEALEDGSYNLRLPHVKDRMKGSNQIYKLVQARTVAGSYFPMLQTTDSSKVGYIISWNDTLEAAVLPDGGIWLCTFRSENADGLVRVVLNGLCAGGITIDDDTTHNWKFGWAIRIE